MKTVKVELGARAYPIMLDEGLLDRAGSLLAEAGLSGRPVIVTDSNVGPLYADRLAAALGPGTPVCMLPAGEQHKRLDQIETLCGAFIEARLDRSSFVVALGGGVVGDMAGFAAACFMRGIPFAQVPTTIVAQVDSSVGGKTGVNHPLGKNTIGAFHQPSAVLIDMTLLNTLPPRELRAGFAEVIKHGVIADADLFAYLELHAAEILAGDLSAIEYPVLRSCEIKAAVVAEDERETGLRAILNYGHTFGHGIEAVTGYAQYLHGEAVALGMQAAAHLAAALGLVDKDFVQRQKQCILEYGLPVSWPQLPVEDTLALMRHDKKARQGTMKFVVPDRIGHVVLRTDITDDPVRAALDALRRR